MKKVIIGLLISTIMIFANNLNLKLSDGFSAGENWKINMSDNGTFYMMLPMDVTYQQLQSTVTGSNSLLVYRWYQNKDLFEADFGVKSLVIVKLTKDAITYYVYNPDEGKYKSVGNTFDSVKSYLENNIAPKISDSSKKSIFENSYIPSLNKINKNKLYLVKPKGYDLDIVIGLDVSNQGSSNASTLETPPNPPMDINESTSSSSDIYPPPLPVKTVTE